MDAEQSKTTAAIMQRFNDVFQRHDPSGLAALVAEDCVIENTVPAPDGARYVGRDACVALWSGIATAPGTRFDHRRDVRRRRPGDDPLALLVGRRRNSVRGVNLMRVRDGLIVEAMGYVKG